MFFNEKLKELLGENIYGKTHMPYIFYDKDNNKCLLFDIKFGNMWKLYCYQNDELFKINTPSENEYAAECNGFTYYNKSTKKYYITYIFNNYKTNIRQVIFGNGKDLHNIEWTEVLPYPIGTINQKYIVIGYNNGTPSQIESNAGLYVYKHNNENILSCINNDNLLYKINSSKIFVKTGFIYNSNKLIITYANSQTIRNGEGSLIVNLDSSTVNNIILNNNDDCYKASIDPVTSECYYAKCLGGFEARSIFVTDNYKLEKSNLICCEKIINNNN